MAGNQAVLTDVAGAILDGMPIDWASAESSADEADRQLLPSLRLVAKLADLHRRHPHSPTVSAPAAKRETAPRLESWGHLRVLEPIGRGAFGEVYRAWDTRLDREVALKLLAATAGSLRRATSIIEEGRLLARVRHPNVVTIYGAERIDDRVGLWMEFVKGRTLAQEIEQGRVFGASEATEIGIQLCHAVAAVHDAGLVHRDVKAHNVMLTDDRRVVLMDFGTGRELADASITGLAGTPLYLAPEVLAGAEATVRSDIYSVGVVLYHLLTRAYPVQASNFRDLQVAHERGPRTDLRGARPDLPPRLVRVIDRAIDIRPEQRPQNASVLAAELVAVKARPTLVPLVYGAAIAAIIVLAVWIGTGVRRSQSAGPSRDAAVVTTAAMAATHADRPVIAVLPLQNLSSDPDGDYFVDGLTGELIRNLAGIEGLDVRSQTSSFAFKNKPRNLREVGEQLRANLVVEGSVLRAGNRLRITAQLIQVAGDVPLWSDRFDRELKDVFTIQDEIARAIVNQLRLTIGRGQRRYETNLEAYDLYLRGRHAMEGFPVRGRPIAMNAVRYFEQAIEKDANYAIAYAGIADALLGIDRNVGPAVNPTAFPRAKAAAERAAELDPMLSEAHSALALIDARDYAWQDAERGFRRAIDLNPSNGLAHLELGVSVLLDQGRVAEALGATGRAVTLDPLSPHTNTEFGRALMLAGRYTDAIDQLRKAIALDPTRTRPYNVMGRAQYLQGNTAEANTVFDDVITRWAPPGGPDWLACAEVRAGRREKAVVVLQEQLDGALPGRRLAQTYACLGDEEHALESLEKALAEHEPRVAELLQAPELAWMRSSARFAMLRKKVNLAP